MTYPWAIVLSAVAMAIAVASVGSSLKLVPDPVTPETACIQQRGTWKYVSLSWGRWYYVCEFKEAHQP